eukprot:jgi/Phyca11/126395/e_gw1.62.215.1
MQDIEQPDPLPASEITRDSWPTLWSSQRGVWDAPNGASFPVHESSEADWIAAATADPEQMLRLLQHFPFPEEILSTLSARTLEEWTASWRRDCLRGGLTEWRDRCSDKEVVRWLTAWINKFDKPRMQNLLPVVDTREDWLQLRNLHYGGEDILKMCDVSNKRRLAQHILCALIYEHEISVITDSDQPVVNGAYTRLTRHVFALRTTPAYKVACKPTSQTLDWYSVARYFSTAIAHGPTEREEGY